MAMLMLNQNTCCQVLFGLWKIKYLWQNEHKWILLNDVIKLTHTHTLWCSLQSENVCWTAALQKPAWKHSSSLNFSSFALEARAGSSDALGGGIRLLWMIKHEVFCLCCAKRTVKTSTGGEELSQPRRNVSQYISRLVLTLAKNTLLYLSHKMLWNGEILHIPTSKYISCVFYLINNPKTKLREVRKSCEWAEEWENVGLGKWIYYQNNKLISVHQPSNWLTG